LHVINGAYSFVNEIKIAGVYRKLIMKANLIGPHENMQHETVGGDIERLIAEYSPGIQEMMQRYNCTENEVTEVIPLIIRAAFASGAWVIQHENVEALGAFYDAVEKWELVNDPEKFFKVTNLVSVIIPECSFLFAQIFFREYFPTFPDFPDVGNFQNFVAAPITPDKIIKGRDF
jgi:hypothetical protein